MKQNAKDTFKKFVSDYDTSATKIRAKYEFAPKGNIALRIYNFSVKENASMIVIGSKGRTQVASILLGSIAEKLVRLNAEIPLIIVKKKRHNMDVLDVLLKI